MERVSHDDLWWLNDILHCLREHSQEPDAVDFVSERDGDEIRLVYEMGEGGDD